MCACACVSESVLMSGGVRVCACVCVRVCYREIFCVSHVVTRF